MTSYQKLKKENKRLQDEYRKLFQEFYKYLKNPDSYENIQVAQRIKHEGLMSEAFPKYSMLSLMEQLGKTKGDGLYSWITKDGNKS